MILRYFILLCSIILVSCSFRKDTSLSSALELSADNRSELEKVLHHYSKPEDSLKLRAAKYLISNMANKSTQTSAETIAYADLLPEIAKIPKDEGLGSPRIKNLVDEFRKNHPQTQDREIKTLPDLLNIKADFLIKNIDESFRVWSEVPWNKDYTFQQFCEYILPYRSMSESLSGWRTDAYKKPLWWSNGYDTIKNPIVLCDSLHRKIDLTFEGAMGFYPIAQSYPDLLRSHWGYCLDETNYAVFQMRANGIPVAIDFVPHWASLQNRHYWNVIPMPGEKDIMFQVGFARSPGKVYLRQKFAKIFRYTYTIQRDEIIFKRTGREEIPSVFRNNNIKDVTARYNMPVADIEVELKYIPKDTEIAYLCVSSRDKWTPVDYSEIKNGKALFEDVSVGILDNDEFNSQEKDLGDGLVLLVGYYKNGEIIPANDLFHLSHEGKISYIKPNTSSTQSVTLRRKVRKRYAFENFANNMIGTHFEGANRADFSDAVILAKVESPVVSHLQTIELKTPKKYRYIRYVSNNGKTPMIGELQFRTEDGKILNGIAIGTQERRYFRPKEKAFDGDVVSYYEPCEPNSWIGLDLGISQQVTSLSFCPRTDGNDVEPDNLYSLSYWDDKWITISQKKASEYSITFERVPSNALLLLKNHTQGTEERIFTYQNGKQVWW